jgi:hypothetical protein
MASKQAQFLIPSDRILCSLVQADATNGVINREFLFDGLGNQFNGGVEADPTLQKLILPKTAITETAEGALGIPEFPVADYLALLKAKDFIGAGKLQGEFHAKLDTVKATTGQQSLADSIITALFAFLARQDLQGWTVDKEHVICRVPARATPETPIIVVVQPQPVWGAR